MLSPFRKKAEAANGEQGSEFFAGRYNLKAANTHGSPLSAGLRSRNDAVVVTYLVMRLGIAFLVGSSRSSSSVSDAAQPRARDRTRRISRKDRPGRKSDLSDTCSNCLGGVSSVEWAGCLLWRPWPQASRSPR